MGLGVGVVKDMAPHWQETFMMEKVRDEVLGMWMWFYF